MNVFTPYPSPIQCAKALWADKRRYNKQIIECRQIILAIEGAKAWRNHPVCLMYKEHKNWLELYRQCFVAYRNYMKSDYSIGCEAFINAAKEHSNKADKILPSFLTDEFCDQHKRRLYTKSPDLYPQFAEYGKSYENWYFVDGELKKYLNGKLITKTK